MKSGRFSHRSSVSCWESSLFVLVLCENFSKIMNGSWMLSSTFLHLLDWSHSFCFLFFKSSIVDYVDSFSNVELIIWNIFQECKICLPFEYKSLLVIVYYQFLDCRIWFVTILFRIFFIFVHERDCFVVFF